MLDEFLLELVATLDDVLDDFAEEEIAVELKELLLTLLATALDETLEDDFTILLTLTELELVGTLFIEEAALVVTLELDFAMLELARLCEVAVDEVAVDEVAVDDVAVEEIASEELVTDLTLLVLELVSPPPPPHAVKLMARATKRLTRINCRNLFIIVIIGGLSSVARVE